MRSQAAARSELTTVAAVLRSIADLAAPGGVLSRLHMDIQQPRQTGTGLHDAEMRMSVFTGMPGTAGAGVDGSPAVPGAPW